MQHLEEGEIHAWLDGALSEAEGARIEQHAATCKECAAMVADARGLIAGAARIVSALDHVPSGVIPKSGAATASRPLWRALRLTPFRAAMAASLIVAAGSLIVVQRKDRELMVPMAAEKIAMPMAASAPPPSAPIAADKVALSDASAANEARPRGEARSARAQASVSKTTLALQDTALLMKPAAPTVPPAPAPKVASADDERAKKERDAALSSVVVTSAPASATGGAARGNAQGQAQAQAQTGARDSVRASAGIALRRALPPAVQRAEGAASFAGVAPTNFLGCYQVVDTASWPRSLPVRFGIFSDSAPRVRLIRPGVEQRPVIGRWQNVSATGIAITLDSSSTTSFTLTQIGTEIVATPTSAPAVRARVLRPSCAL